VSDPRDTPANARAALASLRGRVVAPRYVEGEAARILLPLADLLSAPAGARERQLLWGESVTVIDRYEGWAFVQAGRDGYCGYLPEPALGPPRAATHSVAVPATHLLEGPKVQRRDLALLSFGARVTVTGETGRFAETPEGFLPLGHLRPLDQPFADPVAVAELFLGTPYLWGGNSRSGIDCSGLVQAALLACAIPCPGDSDQQQALGQALAPDAPLQRGDLLFWRGHVALAVDAGRLIHANGHAMAVAHEGTEATLARIAAEGLPLLMRRRL